MTRDISSHERANATKIAVRVLEFFANESRMTFNRPLALRTITEMVRAIAGDDFLVWSQRLVEAGKSLKLRTRCSDLEIRDAVNLVRQGIPVVACFSSTDELGERTVQWIALDKVRRGKVRVLSFDGSDPQWLWLGKLASFLGCSEEQRELRWITGQPALPCAVDVNHPLPAGKRIRPFERLLGLIRAERSDLWAVFVFAIVVGTLALAAPIAVEALVNTVAFGRYLQPVVVLSIILLTFLGFAAAISALRTFVVELIQRRLFVRVVEDLAYRLPRVEQSAIDGYHAPELGEPFLRRRHGSEDIRQAAARRHRDGADNGAGDGHSGFLPPVSVGIRRSSCC